MHSKYSSEGLDRERTKGAAGHAGNYEAGRQTADQRGYGCFRRRFKERQPPIIRRWTTGDWSDRDGNIDRHPAVCPKSSRTSGRKEKKKRQMMLDYPEIVNKVDFIPGAGMTVKERGKSSGGL